MTLAERAKQLEAVRGEIDRALNGTAQAATIKAVEKAADLTPPTGGRSGTHTRTGELKQHWASDSEIAPKKRGNEYQTVLANNMEYASYVNDGHNMDRHFVPGLYINPSGLLEYDEEKKGEVGLVVGTKTKYVPGLHMTDEAKKTYERSLKDLPKKLKELIE